MATLSLRLSTIWWYHQTVQKWMKYSQILFFWQCKYWLHVGCNNNQFLPKVTILDSFDWRPKQPGMNCSMSPFPFLAIYLSCWSWSTSYEIMWLTLAIRWHTWVLWMCGESTDWASSVSFCLPSLLPTHSTHCQGYMWWIQCSLHMVSHGKFSWPIPIEQCILLKQKCH